MKIGFISIWNLNDRKGWSGTISNLSDILSKEYSIVPIVVEKNKIEQCMKAIDFICSLGKRKNGFFRKKYTTYRFHKKIKENKKNCDIYFAPAQSELISLGVPTDKKLVYLSDAVFRLMVGYYWSNIDSKLEQYLDYCEASALKRADAVIFASEWAKDGAVNFYQTDSQKIHVLPFGANMIDRYQGYKEHATDDNTIRLLLVGVEWKRKGVDIAIDCVRLLNKRQNKYSFDLTIIGVDKPASQEYEPYIHILGRLNKDVPEEYDRMISYYQNSDLFLLPTKAECAGIVFAEAAEYGMPSITHKTGGGGELCGRRRYRALLATGFHWKRFCKCNYGHHREWPLRSVFQGGASQVRKRIELEQLAQVV